MPKCSYCASHYEINRGMTYIKTDGTILHLCCAKCKKNYLMKRRKIRWVSKTKKDKTENNSLESKNLKNPASSKVQEVKQKDEAKTTKKA
jgi:ribosomal protein L24E